MIHEHEPLHEHDHEHETGSSLDAIDRRNFLMGLGASFASLSLPACDFRPPKEKIVPYLEKPEEVTVGASLWYASTCSSCSGGCGILVKNRDGRPIKLEGNPDHPINQGGLCAKGQASILELYDSERLKEPLSQGNPALWSGIDSEITKKLQAIQEKKGKIRILSTSLSSPSWMAAIAEFERVYSTSYSIVYDPISYSAILEAHAHTHESRILPWYRLDKAKVLVSFDADFLGTWLSPVEFTKAWSTTRKISKQNPGLSWHIQLESRYSISGASADQRVPLRPSQYFSAILQLAEVLTKKLNRKEKLPAPTSRPLNEPLLEKMANRLISAKGRSLILCGVNDLATQIAVNFLNHILDNYGSTVDILKPSLQFQGEEEAMDRLITQMNEGEIDALILYEANPAYDHPKAEAFREGMKKVGLTISLASRKDETASLSHYVCPDHYSLESWGDAHPHYGVYSIYQPVIAPLYQTRSAIESLLIWAGKPKSTYDFVRDFWKEKVFPQQKEFALFESFWNESVQKGVALIDDEKVTVRSFHLPALNKVKATAPFETSGYEIVVYPSIALGSGRQANNPWLQELPDPISKTTWGNFVAISPASAKKLNVVEGRMMSIISGKTTMELPALIQQGLPENVVAIPLGYGRTMAGKVAANFPTEKMFAIEKEENPGGADAYPFIGARSVQIQPLNRMSPLAKTQQYDFQEVPLTQQKRPLSLSISTKELETLLKQAPHGEKEEVANLWPDHTYPNHHWGMAIDLNACSGCSGCVVACQAENNVPVVGKVEIAKSREMHWLRIDRYYSGSEKYPEENPEVAFMPMMCQHCDHAPCETVCPVLATVHSSEGLNMQVYNRCVGTRYCANNCPYKVRRFNWFDYAHNDTLQNLSLNPDITVRTRGIMEKCTFCVQRITEGKINAKAEDRKPVDGDIKPACAQSCPANAIIFGDMNDPKSAISKAIKDPRHYVVLGDLGTKPSVHYLKKVRNREE